MMPPLICDSSAEPVHGPAAVVHRHRPQHPDDARLGVHLHLDELGAADGGGVLVAVLPSRVVLRPRGVAAHGAPELPRRRAHVAGLAAQHSALARSAASRTAGVSICVVMLPPDAGPCGSAVSPMCTLTSCGRTPITSATTCAQAVRMPPPMSATPLRHSMLPSSWTAPPRWRASRRSCTRAPARTRRRA